MLNCDHCYHYHICELQYRLEDYQDCKHYKNKHMIAEALEKRIPYKPKEYEDRYYGCKCGNILLMKWKHYPTKLTPKSEGLPYCLACGQKIDWSEE